MRDVWKAADSFAAAFAASPHTAVFREGLRPKPSDPNDPMHIQSVQHLLVTYSQLQTQPLLLGIRLPHIPEFGQLHQSSEEVRRWFEVAERFSAALLEAVEFLRSRLPGYPRVLVPELLPESPRVANNGFWDASFPWMLELRRAGLQLQSQPQVFQRALQLPDASVAGHASLAVLLERIRQSPPWQRFVGAHDALSAADWDDLKARRHAYRSAASDERLDEIAGEYGLPRAQARRAVLTRVRADAVGAAREYLEAFVELDEVLDAVVALISHRVAKGDIEEANLQTADWGSRAVLRKVRVVAAESGVTPFPHPYYLFRLSTNVPSLTGAMLVHGLTAYLDDDVLVMDGRLLNESADLPTAGPPVG